MYLFCINKLLFLGVQEFVYRWMTPCMHTKWFYKCWLESGRAKQCPWADSADSTAGWAEQPPGLCILRKYQEGCLGGASPAAETVVSSGLCQVHIVLHKGEKAVFMCPQFLHLFAALSSTLATWWQLLNSVMWTVVLLPVCIALVSTFRIQQNTNIKQEYNLLWFFK